MSEKLLIEIEIVRNHPAAKDVVEIYSPLLGRHWVYINELIAAQVAQPNTGFQPTGAASTKFFHTRSLAASVGVFDTRPPAGTLGKAAQQEATSDGAKCAACGSLNLVPAIHCQDCGYSLPPRA